MIRRFNFFNKVYSKLNKYFTATNEPVILILNNEAELEHLTNALADATLWTGIKYDKILDRSIIL